MFTSGVGVYVGAHLLSTGVGVHTHRVHQSADELPRRVAGTV